MEIVKRTRKLQILVMDTYILYHREIDSVFQNDPVSIEFHADLEGALRRLKETQYSAIIVNLDIPLVSEETALSNFHSLSKGTPIFVITENQVTDEKKESLKKFGAEDIFCLKSTEVLDQFKEVLLKGGTN